MKLDWHWRCWLFGHKVEWLTIATAHFLPTGAQEWLDVSFDVHGSRCKRCGILLALDLDIPRVLGHGMLDTVAIWP